MAMHGATLHQGIRDPFSWKEAISPVVSRSGSRAGSVRGDHSPAGSTPRCQTPPVSPPPRSATPQQSAYAFPRSSTPPLASGFQRSPTPPQSYGGAYEGESAASSRSNLSARSGGSARGYAVHYPEGISATAYYPAGAFDGLSARTAEFHTPEPSARSSAFYDANSACASSRNMEFGALYGVEEVPRPTATREGGERRRHRAFAAALDAFTPSAPLIEERSTTPPIRTSTPTMRSSTPTMRGEHAAPLATEDLLNPTRVFSAARHGRHKEVEEALVAGFNPTFADTFGNTLFHVACQNGNKRIGKLAIKYGGDMDAQNIKGQTGLHFLFAYGYPDVAEYFIEKGADETIQNEFGKTAREGLK